MFWKPGWVERDADEFKARVRDALHCRDGGWVCDGNYMTKLGNLVVSRADTVIFVNMPWRVMYRRVLMRGIARAMDGRQICGENRETWRQLVSSDSLVWWHLKHRKKYLDRPRRVRALTPTDTPLIQLDSPRQLDQFYARFGLTR
ncbi:MAG: hypothetical protein MJE77_08835 [Proteobacteria bacterium]|nr:hypothetical protein [Pseudomonadota bacterium]